MRFSLPGLVLFVTSLFLLSPFPSALSTPPPDASDPSPRLPPTSPDLPSPAPLPSIRCTLTRPHRIVTLPSKRSEIASILPQLDAIAKELRAHPHWQIRIEVHTDARGTEAFNLRLSEQRALAVLDFFLRKGIAKERLSARGYGELCPLLSLQRKAHARNNRIQFILLRKDFSTPLPGSLDLPRLHFAFRDSTLPPEASPILDLLAERLTREPSLRLQIAGHSSLDEDRFSIRYGRLRAQATADGLQARGISPSRLQIQDFGHSMPIDSNRTSTGRQNNQRVDFRLLPSP